MAITLLERELAHYDPLFAGRMPMGMASGVAMVCGRAGWIDPAGRHLLFRGEDSIDNIDLDMPVGAQSPTSATPTQIKNFTTYPQAADTTYYYRLQAVGRGGAIELNTDNVLRIDTDENGDSIDPVPNPPVSLQVEPRIGGAFALRWAYNDYGEQAPVDHYNVYHDNGTGTIDYDTPLSQTSGLAIITSAYAHGTKIKFVVRAESAGGDEETNTVTVEVVADDQGPPDCMDLILSEGVESA